MAEPRRAALVFIFITVALDMLALGMIIPVLPGLVTSFVGGDRAEAATLYGLFGTTWALMQFVFSPLLGALSDRLGRRPVVLLSNFGLAADYVLMALAPNIGWLFAGRVLSGITAASIPTAYAYVADVTPPDKRAGGFGMLGAAFGLGFVLGPALGGLLGGVDPRLPFWVASGLSLANACYGLFVLPESLPKDRRGAFSWQRANPLGALTLLRSHPQLLGLAGVNFLGQLAHHALPSTFVLYAGFRYGWTERAVGLTLAGVGVSSAIVQGGLVRRAVKRFGERRALLIGLAAGGVGFALYGWAPTGALFLLGVPVMALWGLANPASQALMSRRIEPSAQGQLQGAGSSLNGMAGMFGPAVFTAVFAYFIGPRHPFELPGAPFLLAAMLIGLAWLLAARVTRPAAEQKSPEALTTAASESSR